MPVVSVISDKRGPKNPRDKLKDTKDKSKDKSKKKDKDEDDDDDDGEDDDDEPPDLKAALERIGLGPRLSILSKKPLPGLEFLARVDAVVVSQDIEYLEVLTGIEGNNHYSLSTTSGQRIFYAAENSGCCQRCILRGGRAFEINLLDFEGNSVVNITRPCPCGLICCLAGLCKNKAFITHMDGELLGVVKQQCACSTPAFYILGPTGRREFYIFGPKTGNFCCAKMCCHVTFTIYLGDKVTAIGEITKRWGGMAKESMTSADTFGVTFPADLDSKAKAMVLGAVFLIDFMYFEHSFGGG